MGGGVGSSKSISVCFKRCHLLPNLEASYYKPMIDTTRFAASTIIYFDCGRGDQGITVVLLIHQSSYIVIVAPHLSKPPTYS
jgi:hypothetical protein